MMLGNSLLLWKKLINPGNVYSLWDLRQTGNSEAKRVAQFFLKDPVKVTERQMWFDLTVTGTPNAKTDCQFDTVCQPVENLKTSTAVQIRPFCPHHPWCPTCSREASGSSSIQYTCLSCAGYKMQAKITSRSGPLRVIQTPGWAHYSLAPQK